MEEFCKSTSFEEFREMFDSLLVNLFETEIPDNFRYQVPLALKNDFKDLLCHTGCDVEKLKKVLLNRGYDVETVEHICSAIEKRKNDLLYLILIHHNSKLQETIATCDWNVKLVLGSSELHTLKYSILQLALTTVTKSGDQKKRLYEIDKKTLASLIKVLEGLDV
ncbi:unnamed protein product [Leptidea sinapis]|uniref:COMM domain-containing protein n=1 Tax=Leptidea sinapis TaxID=189913 RepID=A0A5E4Q1M7_9NEOP|nr:unnamed protein product [Leptidea sinapis]